MIHCKLDFSPVPVGPVMCVSRSGPTGEMLAFIGGVVLLVGLVALNSVLLWGVQ
jgi:hypothetical protein